MKPAPEHEVRIVEFAQTRVAALAHRGDPRRIGESVRRFVEWRRQNGLAPSTSATFNIVYDHSSAADPDAFHYDLCAATERDVADNSLGVVAKIIPGGRCAVLRHVGTDAKLSAAIAYLCSQWLPQSGEMRRDFPVFLQRVRFFPEVPPHESVLDVFLPLK